jgi:pimeloyl-ACP methyl ester carboxylesterase
MHRVAFFHANGYPPGVYNQFFDALRNAVNASGIEAEFAATPFLETSVDCKAHLRWPTMLGIAQQHAAANEANVLIGHSMGGYLALQVAASASHHIDAIVLIDSPIPRLWRSGLLTFSQLTGLAYKFGPAPVANRRRDTWLGLQEAREFFANKAFVKRWASGVLDDFIAHALTESSDGVTLTIPKNTEREIYAQIVHTHALAALRKVQRKAIAVTFIAGTESEEARLAGYAANKALFEPRFVELDGVGHLIPMEAPERCAEAIAKALVLPRDALENT